LSVYSWELAYFGHTSANPNADPDGDGLSNYQEYLAGTDPNNAASNLRITFENFSSGGTNAALDWNSVNTRFYYIQKTPGLGSPRLDGQRLGNHRARRNLDRSQLHRHQRAGAILSRPSRSPTHAVIVPANPVN
jgi:hypothetical protein